MPDMRTDEQKKNLSNDIRSGLEEAFDELTDEGGEEDVSEHENSGIHDVSGREESEREETGSESASEEILGTGEQTGGDEEDEVDVSTGDEEKEEDVDTESESSDHVDEDEDEEVSEESRSENLEPGTIEPHVTWPEHVKDEFKALPDKSQKFLVESFRGMQADYTRKMQGISGVNRALEPIRGKLVEAGVSEEAAIGELVQNFLAIESKPVEAIKRLINIYKVDPAEIGAASGNIGDESNTGINSEVGERVKRLEQQNVEIAANAVAQRTQHIDSAIEQLKSTGQVPFYSEVENDMISIVDTCEATGRPIPSIPELYKMACSVRPDIVAKMETGATGNVSAGNDVGRKSKLAKSKRAARNIKTSASESTNRTKPKTLKGELEHQFDRLSAAE